ncbi:septum formation inhibitor Maf [Aestuariicella hydrocarbonica]|uniref:dTTP/UTP pyrophosphatase n=1 Tax=Pseudomaricurvus hydrocarbonicus TaxID=1470433 RepID=A0A9E5JPX6_9GAMM|nr:nucleoside triphosphate pyrophosphatase [Aestuariicella hydrocarbonica]NHO64319.1 septum formation inhibitor Maf [Aestuariicella hydrocarbonica]
MVDLYLASQSPRRRELLAQIGVQYQVLEVNVPERQQSNESPREYVQRLAQEKSQAGWRCLTDANRRADAKMVCPVLGADTLIEFQGRVLEKPENEADEVAMLGALSGQTHRVLSAVALTSERGTAVKLSVTDVRFRPLSEQEVRRYWRTGEPADKAGGYGIQGLGAVFVEHLSGSYSGVVGLPLNETRELLEDYGVAYWIGQDA